MTTFSEIENQEGINQTEKYLLMIRKIFDEHQLDPEVIKVAWFFSTRRLLPLIVDMKPEDRANIYTVTDDLVKLLGDHGFAFRRRLPDERQAITKKFVIGGVKGYFTVGMFENGDPGELFITVAKEGSTLRGLIDGIGVSVSMALQHGVPLETLVEKLSYMRFEPQGFTGDPDIKIAHSILDFIFRWIGNRFIKKEEPDESKLPDSDKEPESDEKLAPSETPYDVEKDDATQPNENNEEKSDDGE